MSNSMGLSELLSNQLFYVKLRPEFVRELFDSIGSLPVYRNRQLASKLGVAWNSGGFASTIRGWYHCRRLIPSPKLIKLLKISKFNWNDLNENLIGLKTGQGKSPLVKPKFPITLNRKMGSLVGHVLGDGAIDAGLNSTFYSNSNKELLCEFMGIARQLFFIEPRIWIQKSGNFKSKSVWIRRLKNETEIVEGAPHGVFCPRIVAAVLFAIFGKFAYGKKKYFPSRAFTAPLDFKIGLVRAFLDDESTVDVSSRQIRVFQDNRETLECFRRLLREIGVSPGPIHSYRKYGKDRYYFSISGYINLERYSKRVGFTNPNKALKLKILASRVNRARKFDYNLPRS